MRNRQLLTLSPMIGLRLVPVVASADSHESAQSIMASAKRAAEITRRVTRPWTLMEVCGGQTHSIVRFGIDSLVPRSITLAHGPGCPVCVTPVGVLDVALDLC